MMRLKQKQEKDRRWMMGWKWREDMCPLDIWILVTGRVPLSTRTWDGNGVRWDLACWTDVSLKLDRWMEWSEESPQVS